MRKTYWLLMAMLVLGMIFAGCAAPAAAPADMSAEDGEAAATDGCDEPVTIRFWHHWGGNRVPLMEEQVARFEELNPCIKVDMTLQPWDQRLEKILTSVAAGEPPDVTMLGRHDLPAFVEQGALVPLDDWMAADGVTGDMFYEAEFRGSQYDGQTWILPLPTGGALNILWINNAWLEEAGLDPTQPPQTWADLEEIGEALSIVEDGTLKKVGINVLGVGNTFLSWLYSNGGTWISDDLKTIEFNSPEGLETLQWLVDYTNTYNGGIEEVTAFYAQTGEWENGPFYNDFEAMQINGSWEFFKIQEYNSELVENMTVSAMPAGPSGDTGHGIAFGGWGYVIPKNAAHPDEAWKLVKWLTAEMDGACWFLQQQARPSPMIECNEDPVSGEGNPYWDDILEVMSQDVWVPISPVQPQVAQILTQMMEEAAFGVKTPEEALEWGAAESQDLLDEFWASN